MEFESVRSERDANEESPFLQRSSDPGASRLCSATTHKKGKRKKLERTLLSSFDIDFDHILVINDH